MRVDTKYRLIGSLVVAFPLLLGSCERFNGAPPPPKAADSGPRSDPHPDTPRPGPTLPPGTPLAQAALANALLAQASHTFNFAAL